MRLAGRTELQNTGIHTLMPMKNEMGWVSPKSPTPLAQKMKVASQLKPWMRVLTVTVMFLACRKEQALSWYAC